jgi:hypothetical protein
MSENYFTCACGFKCVEGQLAKTSGACPRCGKRTESMKLKFSSEKTEQTNLAKLSRGEVDA